LKQAEMQISRQNINLKGFIDIHIINPR